jgi:hypothetical protein
VKSSRTTAGLIALLTVVAFGAGLGLRLWNDAEGSEGSASARPLGGEEPAREIRLAGADPGTLRRPARRRSEGSNGATAPAPPVFVPRAAPVAPRPAPIAEPSPESSPAPSPAPRQEGEDDSGGDTFDLEG